MANFTIDQLQKWNGMLSNGFKLDIQHLAVWKEKQAVKYISLEDGRTLTATLGYRKVKHPNGFSYTGKVQPEIHLQVWSKGSTEGMLVSAGLGVFIDIGTEQSRQQWNELCKLSTTLDEAKIMELHRLHQAELAKTTIF